ncbi:MAG: hypothetical protein ABSH16_06405 [Sedimentisphaerales bacterium]
MAISVSFNGENFEQVIYSKEDAFEQLIAQNAKTIFGNKAIYLDTKRKINKSGLGETIPDGFLINLSEPDDPEFYLVEIELKNHDFLKHILPQITKFFDFYSSSHEQQNLTGQIFSILKEDNDSGNKLRGLIGSNETYKFLKDTVESSQKILIIIDGLKPEFEKMMNTHKDTWGKMVRVLIINHFQRNNSSVLTVEPPFQDIPFEDAVSPSPDKEISKPSQYTEEFHLDGCESNTKDIYSKLKSEFLNVKGTLKFNPVKFYIGVRDTKNIAAIRFRKTKLLLEFDLLENEVISEAKHHKVRLYSNRGPMVEINDTSHWDEIQKLISKLVEVHQAKTYI